MPIKPFSFECTQCGLCCSWGGWVCLDPRDVFRLANYLNVTVQQFADRYTDHIAVEYRNNEELVIVPYLALKSVDNNCVFLKDKLCSVHDVKPIHCEQSPLLAEFLLDEEGWEKFSEMCEGVGKGSVITRPEIDHALRMQAERDMEYERKLEEVDWNLGRLLGIDLPEPQVIPDLGVEIEIEDDGE